MESSIDMNRNPGHLDELVNIPLRAVQRMKNFLMAIKNMFKKKAWRSPGFFLIIRKKICNDLFTGIFNGGNIITNFLSKVF